MSANSGGTEVSGLLASENIPTMLPDSNDALKRQCVSRKRDVELVLAQPTQDNNVVSAIVSAVNPPQQIDCIQQLNQRKFLVSFKSVDSAEYFHRVLAPSLRIAGSAPQCKWLGVERRKIRVAFLPCAVANSELAEALKVYGRIIEITDEFYADTPVRIKTGTRIVEMEMTSPVPNIIKVCGFSVPVTYKGVVLQCRRCLLTGHLKSDCNTPFCDRCKSFGHSASHCSAPCLKCRAPDHHWKNCTVRNYAFAATSSGAATAPLGLPDDELKLDLLTASPVKSNLNELTIRQVSSSPVTDRDRSNCTVEEDFNSATENNSETETAMADAVLVNIGAVEIDTAVNVTLQSADEAFNGGPWQSAKQRSKKRKNMSITPDKLPDAKKLAGTAVSPKKG